MRSWPGGRRGRGAAGRVLTLRDATSRTLEMVREALQEAGEGMEGMEAQISDLDGGREAGGQDPRGRRWPSRSVGRWTTASR